MTAQFGGVGDDNSIIQKTINKEDENNNKSFEEKEDEEDGDEKQENGKNNKNNKENITENKGKELVNDSN